MKIKLIVSQAFFLGKPMWDAAIYFILQATPTISDQNYKHAIQNLRNERYKMNAGIVV